MVDQTRENPLPGKESVQLKRDLQNRHIQLIAIGGTIGTGLFMGSGKSISLAGPSIIFVYMIIGFMLFFVMRAMGELLLSNLKYKSFSDFSADLLGPWAGYFTGWTYCFTWIVTGIADVVAIGFYFQFWFPDFALWISALICVSIFLLFNIATVKLFGELEFWFAIIKIVAIVLLVITGLVLIVISYPSSGGNASLTNLWNHGGWFPHGISGFFAGFQIAVFASVGIELVGTAAAETNNPKRVLPRAINSIPIRIMMFYVSAVVVIMAVTPWDRVSARRSPFIDMFMLTGLPAVASIVNFVVLTAAASSANSGIFSASRMLYGLAHQGVAHPRFGMLSSRAVPVYGLFFSCICIIGGAALIYLIPDMMALFTMITTVSSTLFMFIWSLILCSYLAYRKKCPELHSQSIYKMPLGKIACWMVLMFFLFILVLLTLQKDTRQALAIAPLWFLILTLGWQKYRHK